MRDPKNPYSDYESPYNTCEAGFIPGCGLSICQAPELDCCRLRLCLGRRGILVKDPTSYEFRHSKGSLTRVPDNQELACWHRSCLIPGLDFLK